MTHIETGRPKISGVLATFLLAGCLAVGGAVDVSACGGGGGDGGGDGGGESDSDDSGAGSSASAEATTPPKNFVAAAPDGGAVGAGKAAAPGTNVQGQAAAPYFQAVQKTLQPLVGGGGLGPGLEQQLTNIVKTIAPIPAKVAAQPAAAAIAKVQPPKARQNWGRGNPAGDDSAAAGQADHGGTSGSSGAAAGAASSAGTPGASQPGGASLGIGVAPSATTTAATTVGALGTSAYGSKTGIPSIASRAGVLATKAVPNLALLPDWLTAPSK